MLRTALIAATLALTTLPVQAANEFEGPLTALASAELAVFGTDAAIIDALRAQNAKHAGMSQDEIDGRDAQWRAETAAAASPMIDEVLARPGSLRVKELKESLGGMVTEVIVTDNLGLNVVQSDVTSDYWQGDEVKWIESYGKPAGTIHFGEIELDESTQTYQSQVSFPIFDPDSGEAIGAVTVGIDLSLL